MLIEQLTSQQVVNLEFVMENKSFEIVTKVMGYRENGILIEPLEYKEKVVQLDSKKKGIRFNLYADDHKGNRIAWMNVDLATIEYKGRSYYAIYTRSYNRNSVSADRRKYERTPIFGVKADIFCSEGVRFVAVLNDISGAGVSFLHEPIDFNRRNVLVRFEDTINDETYELAIRCHCVREQKMGEQMLYGCAINEPDRKLLSYIFFKRAIVEDEMSTLIDKLKGNGVS